MKLVEVISKHPILTFLVIDEVLVTIENCVALATGVQLTRKTDKVKGAAEYLMQRTEDAIKKHKEDETEPEVEEETEE